VPKGVGTAPDRGHAQSLAHELHVALKIPGGELVTCSFTMTTVACGVVKTFLFSLSTFTDISHIFLCFQQLFEFLIPMVAEGDFASVTC
jgi:hypothetical protein